jgi:hypothetical protein
MIQNMIPTDEEVSILLRRGQLESRGRTWTIRRGALEALRVERAGLSGDRASTAPRSRISPPVAFLLGAGLAAWAAIFAIAAS